MNTYLITVAGYLFFVLSALAIWWFTRDGRSLKIASLEQLLTRVIRYRVTRMAIFFAWWWLGWHFIVNVITRSS
ncbi:MAG: DUF6186 family protein [Micrococcales bacterium]